MKYFVKPIVLFIFLAGSAGVFPSDTLAKDVKEYEGVPPERWN
jgi:hypothetical protein